VCFLGEESLVFLKIRHRLEETALSDSHDPLEGIAVLAAIETASQVGGGMSCGMEASTQGALKSSQSVDVLSRYLQELYEQAVDIEVICVLPAVVRESRPSERYDAR
jgi:hypothetical protein